MSLQAQRLETAGPGPDPDPGLNSDPEALENTLPHIILENPVNKPSGRVSTRHAPDTLLKISTEDRGYCITPRAPETHISRCETMRLIV